MTTTITTVLGGILLMDDFYADPHAVRNFALRQDFTDYQGDKAFLGSETRYPYSNESVTTRLADAVGVAIKHNERQVYGKFRIADATSRRRTKVHFDRSDFAANVYLTPDLPVDWGLGIYRHRTLDLDRVPDAATLVMLGFSDLDEFDRQVVVPDSLRGEQWELIEMIAPTFNRCVVLPGGRFFHAAERGSDDGLGASRLSQHFFFDRDD